MRESKKRPLGRIERPSPKPEKVLSSLRATSGVALTKSVSYCKDEPESLGVLPLHHKDARGALPRSLVTQSPPPRDSWGATVRVRKNPRTKRCLASRTSPWCSWRGCSKAALRASACGGSPNVGGCSATSGFSHCVVQRSARPIVPVGAISRSHYARGFAVLLLP